MKHIFSLTLFACLACFSAHSQVITFKLVDLATNEPLKEVEVFSHEAHDKVSFTDPKGAVKFDIDHTDTLIFFKQGYLPLYIQVKQSNFDPTHVVTLKMRNTSGQVAKRTDMQYNKLQKSHYSFVHDSLSNSSIQVTHFEHPEMATLPNTADKSFHVVQIDLEKSGAGLKHRYTRK